MKCKQCNSELEIIDAAIHALTRSVHVKLQCQSCYAMYDASMKNEEFLKRAKTTLLVQVCQYCRSITESLYKITWFDRFMLVCDECSQRLEHDVCEWCEV